MFGALTNLFIGDKTKPSPSNHLQQSFKDACGVTMQWVLDKAAGTKLAQAYGQTEEMFSSMACNRERTGINPDGTSHGNGLTTDIPLELMEHLADKVHGEKLDLEKQGKLGVAQYMLPQDESLKIDGLTPEQKIKKIIKANHNIKFLGWSDIPMDQKPGDENGKDKDGNDISLSEYALEKMPRFKRAMFVFRDDAVESLSEDTREKICNELYAEIDTVFMEFNGAQDAAKNRVTGMSLSSQSMTYRGLFRDDQFMHVFPEFLPPEERKREFKELLGDALYKITRFLTHGRQGTNTGPEHSNSHPFGNGTIGCNGEINTHVSNGLDRTLHLTEVNKTDQLDTRFGADSLQFAGDMMERMLLLQNSVKNGADPEAVLGIMDGLAPQIATSLQPSAIHDEEVPQDVRDMLRFYSYLRKVVTGPTNANFMTHKEMGNALDNAGLRPARYLITAKTAINDEDRKTALEEMELGWPYNLVKVGDDGLPTQRVHCDYRGSEDIPTDKELAEKGEYGLVRGKLSAGKMLVRKQVEGKWRYFRETELLEEIADKEKNGGIDFGELLKEMTVKINEADHRGYKPQDHQLDFYTRAKTYFWNREYPDVILLPMMRTGKMPVTAMGDDGQIHSATDEHMSEFMRELFAQISNPSLDFIREPELFSFNGFIGACPLVNMKFVDGKPVWDETANKLVEYDSPYLMDNQIDFLKDREDYRVIDITFDVPQLVRGTNESEADFALKVEEANLKAYNAALVRITEEATDAAIAGDKIILSDRNISTIRNTLQDIDALAEIRTRLREAGEELKQPVLSNTKVVVETGQAQNPLHAQKLFAKGATAVNTYMINEYVAMTAEQNQIDLTSISDEMADIIIAEAKKLGEDYTKDKLLWELLNSKDFNALVESKTTKQYAPVIANAILAEIDKLGSMGQQLDLVARNEQNDGALFKRGFVGEVSAIAPTFTTNIQETLFKSIYKGMLLQYGKSMGKFGVCHHGDFEGGELIEGYGIDTKDPSFRDSFLHNASKTGGLNRADVASMSHRQFVRAQETFRDYEALETTMLDLIEEAGILEEGQTAAEVYGNKRLCGLFAQHHTALKGSVFVRNEELDGLLAAEARGEAFDPIRVTQLRADLASTRQIRIAGELTNILFKYAELDVGEDTKAILGERGKMADKVLNAVKAKYDTVFKTLSTTKTPIAELEHFGIYSMKKGAKAHRFGQELVGFISKYYADKDSARKVHIGQDMDVIKANLDITGVDKRAYLGRASEGTELTEEQIVEDFEAALEHHVLQTHELDRDTLIANIIENQRLAETGREEVADDVLLGEAIDEFRRNNYGDEATSETHKSSQMLNELVADYRAIRVGHIIEAERETLTEEVTEMRRRLELANECERWYEIYGLDVRAPRGEDNRTSIIDMVDIENDTPKALRKKLEALDTQMAEDFLNGYVTSEAYKEFSDKYRKFLEKNPIAERDYILVDQGRNKRPALKDGDMEFSRLDMSHRVREAQMSRGALKGGPWERQKEAFSNLRKHNKSAPGEGGQHISKVGTKFSGLAPQFASGRFSLSPELIAAVIEADGTFQIKVVQGAKPGEGGEMPAGKVTVEIAGLRQTTIEVQLPSPAPGHDIYSIEDLKQLIYDIKSITRGEKTAQVDVKIATTSNASIIAQGAAVCGADIITLAGHDGGTGAAPGQSARNTGVDWLIGKGIIDDVRALGYDNVKFAADGGVVDHHDLLKALWLGYDMTTQGTMLMVTNGCIMARVCNAAGISPEEQKKFIEKFTQDYGVNYDDAATMESIDMLRQAFQEYASKNYCPTGITNSEVLYKPETWRIETYQMDMASAAYEWLRDNGYKSIEEFRNDRSVYKAIQPKEAVGIMNTVLRYGKILFGVLNKWDPVKEVVKHPSGEVQEDRLDDQWSEQVEEWKAQVAAHNAEFQEKYDTVMAARAEAYESFKEIWLEKYYEEEAALSADADKAAWKKDFVNRRNQAWNPVDARYQESLAELRDEYMAGMPKTVINGDDGQPIDIGNCDRTVLARTSGNISLAVHDGKNIMDLYPDRAKVPESSVEINLRGNAGQSFGAFLAHGVKAILRGTAQNYVGKSMCGGKLIITPDIPEDHPNPEQYRKNYVVAGDVCLYGANGGIFYALGKVGERFGVCKHGGVTLCHEAGTKYCTNKSGGFDICLGKIGKGSFNEMSGGLSVVYNKDGMNQNRFKANSVKLAESDRAKDFALRATFRVLADAAVDADDYRSKEVLGIESPEQLEALKQLLKDPKENKEAIEAIYQDFKANEGANFAVVLPKAYDKLSKINKYAQQASADRDKKTINDIGEDAARSVALIESVENAQKEGKYQKEGFVDGLVEKRNERLMTRALAAA